MRAPAAVAAAGIAALLAAGCGGTHPRATPRSVTVAKYGAFPADTISAGTRADSHLCRADARSFADSAARYLAHFGAAAATPADTYYMLLREQIADFDVHGCGTGTLSAALATRLTAKQRRSLAAHLPPALARRLAATPPA